ncbi:MAG: HEPN domain-containing protein [Anaerolineae bacterium]
MPASDEVMAVVRQWVQKAENDLTNASFTLKLGKTCPTDTVCFHAQQCVEKYLKALLVAHGIDFARTHQIAALRTLLPAAIRPDLSPEEQELLTDYAVSTRYPGDYETISLKEARQAVRIAKRVRDQSRTALTKASYKLL